MVFLQNNFLVGSFKTAPSLVLVAGHGEKVTKRLDPRSQAILGASCSRQGDTFFKTPGPTEG
jgi:hypothetical protein